MSEHSTIEVVYRPIPGFPDYRAGSDMSVWTLKKRGRPTKIPSSRTRTEWLLLKPNMNKRDGRYQYALRRNGKYVFLRRATAVALAFHGPCPPGLEIRHLDGDKLNDRPENLEYATHAVNMADIRRHGEWTGGIDKILKIEQVAQIKLLLADGGFDRRWIAKRFKISERSLSRIANGRTWSHVQIPPDSAEST